MARIHHSRSARPAARLISTPTQEGSIAMSTTIAGVRFSDQLAALLDHAQANGFRIETDNRGKRSHPGVVVYPPNSELPPITVGERNAKFNKPHYENLRRELYRAGCPALPGDKPTGVIIADTREEAEAQVRAAGDDPAAMIELHATEPGDMFKGEAGSELFGRLVAQLAENQGGLGHQEAMLVAGHAEMAMSWFHQFGDDRVAELVTRSVAMAEENLKGQIDEALKMAAEAEATAERATKALAAAEEREAKARADCGAALDRAKAAEAKAAEAEAALAPLRSFLGKHEG